MPCFELHHRYGYLICGFTHKVLDFLVDDPEKALVYIRDEQIHRLTAKCLKHHDAFYSTEWISRILGEKPECKGIQLKILEHIYSIYGEKGVCYLVLHTLLDRLNTNIPKVLNRLVKQMIKSGKIVEPDTLAEQILKETLRETVFDINNVMTFIGPQSDDFLAHYFLGVTRYEIKPDILTAIDKAFNGFSNYFKEIYCVLIHTLTRASRWIELTASLHTKELGKEYMINLLEILALKTCSDKQRKTLEEIRKYVRK